MDIVVEDVTGQHLLSELERRRDSTPVRPGPASAPVRPSAAGLAADNGSFASASLARKGDSDLLDQIVLFLNGPVRLADPGKGDLRAVVGYLYLGLTYGRYPFKGHQGEAS